MKTYYKSYGCMACISDRMDGTAQLVIKCAGKKILDKNYRSRKHALAAWKRYCA